MDSDEILDAAARNRRTFADLLESLSAEQLAAPSLCGEWDVATVGAHLAYAVKPRQAEFMVGLLRHRGSFDRANSAAAVKEAEQGLAANIARIRANADSRFKPPVAGVRAPLTDVIVHTGDIARPLGLAHAAPDEHVRTALKFLTAGHPVGFVRSGWLAGLRFVA